MVKKVQCLFQQKVVPFGPSARIDHIINDPVRAKAEIFALRDREKRLKQDFQRKEMEKEFDYDGYYVSGQHLRHTHQAVQIMDDTVMNAGLNNQQRKLWEIQRDWLHEIHENDGT